MRGSTVTVATEVGEGRVVGDTGHQQPRLQFPMIRFFQLAVIIAVTLSLFATLRWPPALLVLSVFNAIASIHFFRTSRARTAILAFTTSVLLLATLFFTNWGLSTPRPVVRVAWPFLVAACVLQLCVFVNWLFSERSRRKGPGASIDEYTGVARDLGPPP